MSRIVGLIVEYSGCQKNKTKNVYIQVFVFSSVSQSGNIYSSSAVVHISLRIARSTTTNQCWQMIVQYTCPVTVNDTWKGVQVINTQQSSEPVTIIFLYRFSKTTTKTIRTFQFLFSFVFSRRIPPFAVKVIEKGRFPSLFTKYFNYLLAHR